jgi:hypothetical protein
VARRIVDDARHGTRLNGQAACLAIALDVSPAVAPFPQMPTTVTFGERIRSPVAARWRMSKSAASLVRELPSRVAARSSNVTLVGN